MNDTKPDIDEEVVFEQQQSAIRPIYGFWPTSYDLESAMDVICARLSEKGEDP